MAAKHHDRHGGMAIVSHEASIGEQALHAVNQQEGNVIHEAHNHFPKGMVTSPHHVRR
jgi:hypothetical protein